MGDGQGRIVLFLIFETAIACMSKHAGNTTKHLLDSQAPIPCQTSSFTREFSLSTNQSAPRGERFTVLPGKVYFQVLPAPRPFVTQRATNARRASALGNTRVRPQPHTPPNVLGDREAFIRTRRGTHSPPSGSRVPSAMLTLARLFPATAVPGVRAERAPLKTVCRATGGGRRNNSRSPKTKPQNVAPGRASTKGTRCFTPRRREMRSNHIPFYPTRFLPETRRSDRARTRLHPRSDPDASTTIPSHRLTSFLTPSRPIKPPSRPVKTPWTRAFTRPPSMPRSTTLQLPSPRPPRSIPRPLRGRPKSTTMLTASSRCVSVPDIHPLLPVGSGATRTSAPFVFKTSIEN
mgnify:CR=1 FL=1